MSERDRQYLEIARRLFDRPRDVIAADVVWHVPGHNPSSGVYRGAREYFEVLTGRMAPLDRWDVRILDLMVNGALVVMTVRLIGERRGRHVDLDGVHLVRIAGHEIVEGWSFCAEQAALDAFFSA